MNVYGADHHLLVLADSIDADLHKHSFIQVTLSLQSSLHIELGEKSINCAGMVIDSNVSHRLNGQGQPLLQGLFWTFNPDALFEKHQQHWGGIRNMMYKHVVRHLMNRNVSHIRRGG